MPGILVVEDDENLNRGITFSLKKSGYEVFSAESVKKAKRIASDNNVDVTICDVNLPDGNGLEFVRWMRSNYNTYIICLTALDQEMDQVMGYEAGADDYITKPFSLSVLLFLEMQLFGVGECLQLAAAALSVVCTFRFHTKRRRL